MSDILERRIRQQAVLPRAVRVALKKPDRLELTDDVVKQVAASLDLKRAAERGIALTPPSAFGSLDGLRDRGAGSPASGGNTGEITPQGPGSRSLGLDLTRGAETEAHRPVT